MSKQRPSPEALHKAVADVLAEIESTVSKPVPGQQRLSAAIAYAHLKRTTNVLKAVSLVSKSGLGSEVGALCRIVTEAAYYVMWMLHENDAPRSEAAREECAQKIIDGQIVEMAKTMKLQAGHGFGSQTKADEATKLADAINAKRFAETAKPGAPAPAKFPEYKLPVGNLAFEAGKHAGENYDLFYRTNCIDAHPTLSAAIKALQGGDGFWHEMNLYLTVATSMLLIQGAYKLFGRDDGDYAALSERIFGPSGLNMPSQQKP